MSKPYSFIPCLEVKELDLHKYFKDKELLTGKMTLELTVVKPIFIADGTFIKSDNKDELVRKFVSFKGEKVIPGSTLKGVVRSIAEIVSYSCQTQNCNCISCLTFGKLGFKGRACFEDFFLKDGQVQTMYIPQLMQPKKWFRDKVKFYYHGDKNVLETGTIAVETVMPEAKFVGNIYFKDISEEQLQLICFSLGLDKTFFLKIGYNKPGYFGSCKVDSIETIIEKDSDKYSFDTEVYAKAWGKNYSKKEQEDIENNKKLLRDILDYNNARKNSDWIEKSKIRTY